MEILRRNKGIDFSAKKSGLLGQAEISLIDVKSGKVTDKIKQKNSFTTALDSLYNGSAFNMAIRHMSLPENVIGSNLNPIALQNPPYRTALGGITRKTTLSKERLILLIAERLQTDISTFITGVVLLVTAELRQYRYLM